MYTVKHSVIKDYINLKISDQDLFPDEAISGTSFYDLIPENNEPVIVRFEDVKNNVMKYINKEINLETFSEWIDSSDEQLDKVAGLIYSIDDLKDNINDLNKSNLLNLIDKYERNK